jgi:hypothetical protein
VPGSASCIATNRRSAHAEQLDGKLLLVTNTELKAANQVHQPRRAVRALHLRYAPVCKLVIHYMPTWPGYHPHLQHGWPTPPLASSCVSVGNPLDQADEVSDDQR